MPKQRQASLITGALLVLALLFSRCNWSLSQTTDSTVGSCSLPLPQAASDEQAIRAVLSAEGDLVVKQDIAHLMALWADDSYVANAKNTPANKDDDQYWLDKDAIRHRYVRTVFPG